MTQPKAKPLLLRRGPSLPRLRIATDRGRTGHDARTPRLPSSPLVNSAFSAYDDDDDGKDDAFGVSHLLDSPLPPSVSQLKAYANGGASELQRAIPGNSGVLASSEADIFSDASPYLLRVDASRRRVHVRLGEDAYASLAGGTIAVSGDGGEASATGSAARAITVMPEQGIAAVAFMRAGEARVNLARGRAMSPPPSSPVGSDEGDSDVILSDDESVIPSEDELDVSRGKRKREVKLALLSSPEEPKRARRVYTSATRQTRNVAAVPAPRLPLTESARSSRSASGKSAAAAPITRRSAPSKRGRSRGAQSARRGPVVSTARPVPAAYRPSPLSGLSFARASDLVDAGVSARTLADTALGKVADVIMLHAKQLGKNFIELLGHLIVIDEHTAPSSFPKRLLVGRPAQVRFFAKSHRLFQPSVFDEFDGTYAIRFWTWWNTIVGDMCHLAPGALRRPGLLMADADLTPLLRGGPNGFGTVVAALVIWIFGFMRTTTPQTTLTFTEKPAGSQVAAWAAAVDHVRYIAAAMVVSLEN
jgi:hypothetical protein